MNPQTFEFRVTVKGWRFDHFLALNLPTVSLTRLRRAIREGAALANGRNRTAGWVLKVGDVATVTLDPTEPTAALPEDIPLNVIFEDTDLLIINKPAGLLAHPSNSQKTGTVLNAAAYHLLNQPQPSAHELTRPILLHRLDRHTSGVLALAKNDRAARYVNRAFKERWVHKSYVALVLGRVAEEAGEIDAPIGRHPRTWPRWQVAPTNPGTLTDYASAQTRFRVRERFANHTLLDLEPLTGRTHQLRLHCAFIGHPIVGDDTYTGTAGDELHEIGDHHIPHQLLHAHTLTFRHPATHIEQTFTATFPNELLEAVERLRSQE